LINNLQDLESVAASVDQVL